MSAWGLAKGSIAVLQLGERASMLLNVLIHISPCFISWLQAHRSDKAAAELVTDRHEDDQYGLRLPWRAAAMRVNCKDDVRPQGNNPSGKRGHRAAVHFHMAWACHSQYGDTAVFMPAGSGLSNAAGQAAYSFPPASASRHFSMRFGDQLERVVNLLAGCSHVPLRKLHLFMQHVFIGDFAQKMLDYV
jgi:hypothetical protein